MNIIVHGSYFSNNFGDTLLVKLACDYIISIYKEANIFLATKPTKEEAYYLKYPVVTSDIKVDRIFYTGGGYFGEQPGNFIKIYLWSIRNWKRHLSWYSKYKDVKTGVFGVGVGPISSKWFRNNIINFIGNAEMVMVRDIESFNYLNEYGIKNSNIIIGVDYALKLMYEESHDKERLLILHLPIKKLNAEFISDLKTIIKKYSAKKYQIKIISDSLKQNINYEKNKFIYKYLNDKYEFIKYENPDQLVVLLKKAEIIITSKLHVGIVGLSLGANILSVAQHPKTQRLYKQLGVSDYSTPLYSYNSNRIFEAVNNLDHFQSKINREYVDSQISLINNSITRFLK